MLKRQDWDELNLIIKKKEGGGAIRSFFHSGNDIPFKTFDKCGQQCEKYFISFLDSLQKKNHAFAFINL